MHYLPLFRLQLKHHRLPLFLPNLPSEWCSCSSSGAAAQSLFHISLFGFTGNVLTNFIESNKATFAAFLILSKRWKVNLLWFRLTFVKKLSFIFNLSFFSVPRLRHSTDHGGKRYELEPEEYIYLRSSSVAVVGRLRKWTGWSS